MRTGSGSCPLAEGASEPDKFACFLGCSFTFGKGVQDAETLPAQFQYLNSTYRSYNFGCNGFGPHQVLRQLETSVISEQISQTTGFGMYLFIEDHLRRAAFTLRNATQPIYAMAPRYDLLDGELRRVDACPSFGCYLKNKGLHFLNMSYFLELLGV